MSWRTRFAVVGAVFAVVAGTGQAQDTSTALRASAAVIDALRAGDADAIESRFDAVMREALPHDAWRTTMAAFGAQLGALGACEPPTARRRDAYTVVDTPCAFATMPMTVRLAWNGRGELAGLFIVPPTAAPAASAPPPPGTREEAVTTGAAGWSLPGTLLMPAAATKPPVVVLVHGSGPHDRDETIGPNRPFRDLAEGFAARGIASLRYEKRTHAFPARVAAIRGMTLDDEVVDDAVAALRQVSARADLGPVFVVGHSLGAWLAPRIARRAREAGLDPAGIVMLAGNVSPLADVIVDQYEFAAAAPVPRATADEVTAARTQRDNVARLVATGRVEPGHEALPLGGPPSLWLDMGRYDPAAALLADRGLPALLLFGERDFQVRLAEKDLWTARVAGRPDTTIVVVPRLNHLLIEGDGPMGPAEYGQPGHVASAVIERVAGWIAEHGAARR